MRKILWIKLSDETGYATLAWDTRDRAPGVPWQSLEQLWRLQSYIVNRDWDTEFSTFEHLMYEHNEGGGLAAVDPFYFIVKAKLIERGRQLIKEQEEQIVIERRAKT